MDLLYILNEMKDYKRPKEDLLVLYINERLNKSLQTYYKELSSSVLFLSSKDEMQVCKCLNK